MSSEGLFNQIYSVTQKFGPHSATVVLRVDWWEAPIVLDLFLNQPNEFGLHVVGRTKESRRGVTYRVNAKTGAVKPTSWSVDGQTQKNILQFNKNVSALALHACKLHARRNEFVENVQKIQTQ